MKLLHRCDVINKSWRIVGGGQGEWSELSKLCVALANGAGGLIRIGTLEQKKAVNLLLGQDLVDRVHKRLAKSLLHTPYQVDCINDAAEPHLQIQIQPSLSVASTSDGFFWVWTSVDCKPLVGADVLALRKERPGYAWETILTDVPWSNGCLSEYAHDGFLTNLGLVLFGTREQRAHCNLLPRFRLCRYNAQGECITEFYIGDNQSTLLHELEFLVRECPEEFRESVNELLVNALMHRSYTQPSDIVVHVYPDFLEVENGGGWPVGLPLNKCLHVCRPRNVQLANALLDLAQVRLQCKGLRFVYESQLVHGLQPPEIHIDGKSVRVRLSTQGADQAWTDALRNALDEHELSQKERIALGFIAQRKSLEASTFADLLGLDYLDELDIWLGRLLPLELAQTQGRGAQLRYELHAQGVPTLEKVPLKERIAPELLRSLVLAFVLDHDLVTDTECGIHCKALHPEFKITARMVKFTLNTLALDNLISIDKTRNQWRYGAL